MLNKTNNVGNTYALTINELIISGCTNQYPTHCTHGIINCLFCKHYLVDIACVYFMFP